MSEELNALQEHAEHPKTREDFLAAWLALDFGLLKVVMKVNKRRPEIVAKIAAAAPHDARR